MPALAKGVSPALKKQMQGKTCFNFKTDPEPELIAALMRLTEAAFQQWHEMERVCSAYPSFAGRRAGRMIEDMERVRMTDAEVANNFAAVLEKLKHGAEVVVEQGYRPVAVISPVKGPGRPIDECIALAKAHGSGAKLDEEYAADLEEIIAGRQPLDTSVWD
jgi:antitoxin (DNA-binding transcriptional repressor) of toxin-antitoxin stability system